MNAYGMIEISKYSASIHTLHTLYNTAYVCCHFSEGNSMDGISYAILFMFFEEEMYTTKVVATILMPVNSQHPHQATHSNVGVLKDQKLQFFRKLKEPNLIPPSNSTEKMIK